jgi:hypothetical protein
MDAMSTADILSQEGLLLAQQQRSVRGSGIFRQGTLSAATARIWKCLQAFSKKKIMLNADPALKAVFGGKKQVSMFEMTKLVSEHAK